MKQDKNEKYKDVDAYLETLPAESRNALEKLRKTIRSVVPEALEGFGYGVPAFKFKGKVLVCYAAFKNHCGFYPMSPDVLRRLALDLTDYETAKGTIRFDPKNPLPASLVKKIVKTRLEEMQS